MTYQNDLIIRAAKGEFVERTPVWLMRQAGRILKEYRDIRSKISGFKELVETPELAAEVTSAEVFCDRCTELLLEDKLDSVTASKLKLLTTDLQCRVADECLQLHGGWGYMWEYPVCRAFADSRVQRIYGGSNEIMKLIIARDLMK